MPRVTRSLQQRPSRLTSKHSNVQTCRKNLMLKPLLITTFAAYTNPAQTGLTSVETPEGRDVEIHGVH